MNSSEAKELIRISQLVGANELSVQFTGGNISIKTSPGKILIKESGIRLSQVSEEGGLCLVEYLLNNENELKIISQESFNSLEKEKSRPSMELGFHVLFENFVIHSHPVFLNIFLCSIEGRSILANLFPEAIWIDYATPGNDLCRLINLTMKGKSQGQKIVFLQNHGLIVSGPSAIKTYELHEKIIDQVNKILLPAIIALYGKEESDAKPDNNYFFPDMIVFDQVEKNSQKNAGYEENLRAHNFILKSQRHMGLTPKFLHDTEVIKIKNLESEKFRLKKSLE